MTRTLTFCGVTLILFSALLMIAAIVVVAEGPDPDPDGPMTIDDLIYLRHHGTADPPTPDTIIDECDPAGIQANICHAISLLAPGAEAEAILFNDHPGAVFPAPGGTIDDWMLMNLRTNRVNVWMPWSAASLGATDSKEACQDYVDDACEDAGFGGGKSDASVGPEDSNGCQICSGSCSGGCNENGCPIAAVQAC